MKINPYAVRNMAATGLSASDIARAIGVDGRSIRRVAAKHRITLAKATPGRSAGFTPSPAQLLALNTYRAKARASAEYSRKPREIVPTLYRCVECCQLTRVGPACGCAPERRSA